MRSFVDKDHPVATEFYNIIESKHDIEDIMEIILKDRDFLDPYIYLTERLIDQGHEKEAEMFAEKAFVRALGMILDIDGSWPDELLWGYHENRHIMRVLMRKADFEWREGRPESALALYKKLLKSNLDDNLGTRYAIVGICIGLSYKQFIKQVWPSDTVPAAKIHKWFDKHSPKCAKELAEWEEYCANQAARNDGKR
jgi:tetratricopeptide (TPR) repeat protein